MSDEQLEKLRRVLAIAEKNGNSLYAENIRKEIEALEKGEVSPIVKEYAPEHISADD
ncbi:MAG: hypothetical protein AB8E74_04560 [Prochlorococcus sp.]|nr:hypothetical protein [Prochlorococcaceae cyanobacterium Fu_MAG_50]